MLRLWLLGRPQVILDGQPVNDFVSEKALALLGYLAVRSGKHAREKLADLFWGEMPEARARANLRMALYNLQQLIPGYLNVTRLTAEFNHAAAYWLDVDQLNAEETPSGAGVDPTRPTRPDTQAATLGLYRGDFLDGINPGGAPAFENWLLGERDRLRQQAMRISHQEADQALGQGDYPAAIQALRLILEIEPWQENAHRGLILALARSGDTAGALAQYAACRRVLAEELGIEPVAEITRLAERIQAARQRTRRHNLPPQPIPFVGRKAELASLRKMLNQPQTRLITLTGPGGIGKTRLALQVAVGLVDVFFEGVYFVPLAALSSPADLAPAILDVLDIPRSGAEDPQAQLREALHAQEMLLVLDSFEHLLDGAGGLGELLKAAPGVRILVTSRERLSLQWEMAFPLDGLEIPNDGEHETLESYSAVQFFVQCCRRIKPGFSAASEDQEALRRLCQITEGMPLALELAAAWAAALSLEKITDAIQHNLDLLETQLRDAPPHQRSLRAAIEKSWELLSSAEQGIYARLAIFQGGFTLEASRRISGATPAVLRRLVAKSLLRQDPEERYDLHEMLRQFCREKLGEGTDLEAILEQHSRYYCAFLKQHEESITGAEMAGALREIHGELDNVRAAWRRAASARDLEALERGMTCLSRFYDITSLFQEGEAAYSLAVEGMRALLDPASPQTVHVLARLSIELARFQRALAHNEPALRTLGGVFEILDRVPDAALGAAAHLEWAEILERQGDYAAAGEHYTAALAAALAGEETTLIAGSHVGLGIVSGEGGEIMEAIAHFEEALRLYRSVGNRRGEIAILHNLAIAATFQNDTHGARLYFDQELALARRLGYRRMEMMAHLALGLLAGHDGEYALLQLENEQALKICHEIGDRREAGTALDGLGLAALCQGRYDDASLSLQLALHSHAESGNRQGECISRTYLSLVKRELGDLNPAKEGMEGALAALHDFSAYRDECDLLAHLSVTHHLLGDHTSAKRTAHQALALAGQIGDHSFEANALSALGRALEGMGDPDGAVDAYEKALAYRLEAGQQLLAWESYASLALAAVDRGDPAKAAAQIEGIVNTLAERPPDGLEPFRIYWAAYRAMQAVHDPRNQQVLAAAYQQLQEQGNSIQMPAQRKSFFEQVAVNRAISQAWKESGLDARI